MASEWRGSRLIGALPPVVWLISGVAASGAVDSALQKSRDNKKRVYQD
ncbi:MAG: hypothetical protein ACOX8I_01375 [Bacillota bacterium]